MAAQVRYLVSGSGTAGPAARTSPIDHGGGRTDDDDVDLDDVDDAGGEREPAGRPSAWLPGPDLDCRVVLRPQHAVQTATSLGERLRWNPGRRGAAALGLLVIVLVAAAGWWLASAKPQELPVATVAPPASVAVSGAAGTSGASTPAGSVSASSASNAVSSSSASLVIDVAGKVRRPGIYLLPPGSRVFDALRAAGGVRPGVSTVSLNLAEPLRDGEQIVVGVPGAGAQAPPQSGSGAGGGSAPAGVVVDINTATLDQLDSLPGVGPSTAQKILDYRAGHGAFTSIDQLQNVSGIGPAKFAAMKALVTV